MIFRLLLIVNIFVVAFSWTVNNCPEGVSRDKYLKVFGDKCYEFELFRAKTYKDAQDYCEEDGGTLVLVKNKTINDFITQTAKELHYVHHIKIWTGLVYDSDSKTYVWSDGSEMDYKNFPTDPENKESCIVVDTETGEWVEESCESYYMQRFVCEYMVSDAESKEKKFPTSISRFDCPLFYDDERIIQTFGDMCYVFFTVGRKTYEDANSFCSLFNNGSLVMVKSQEVNDFLEYHMYTTHQFHFESDPVWIGLRYDFDTEDYRWVDGTVPKYTNYQFDERYKECFALSSVNGKWQESTCGHKKDEADDGDKKYFICEMRPRNYHELTTIKPTTQVTNTSGFELSSTTRPKQTHVSTTIEVEPTTMSVTESKTTISVSRASTNNPATSPRAPTTGSNPSASTGRIVSEKATSTITNTTDTQSPSTTTTTPPTTTFTTPLTTTFTKLQTTTTTTRPSATTSATQPSITSTTQQTTTSMTLQTTTPTSPPLTTCESMICNLDCGMSGYKQDPVTRCMVCLCEGE